MSDQKSDPPLAELREVTRSYDGRTRVLDDIDLVIPGGETLAVIGPSGSGKSTLLNMLGALDRPDDGEVRFQGRNLGNLGETKRARFRATNVGFVFQLHHLLPQYSVLENVLLPTLAAGTREGAEERARDLLKQVGLSERVDYRPGNLSGGERQRVAVVRALINEPDLLLADEPTGSLSHTGAEALAELLLELNVERRVTLVVVTHAPDLASRMNTVLELQDGHLSPSSDA